ncbi:MAG: hypothetical protein HY735_23235 [Verrucomicrobia bacterium]|nr:hypothetical protein [Verrucomicrobiota bacterium]
MPFSGKLADTFLPMTCGVFSIPIEGSSKTLHMLSCEACAEREQADLEFEAPPTCRVE